MENVTNTQSLIHDFNSKTDKKAFTYSKFFSLLLLVIVAGLIAGFIFSSTTTFSSKDKQEAKSAKVEKTAGIADKKTIKDKAEG